MVVWKGSQERFRSTTQQQISKPLDTPSTGLAQNSSLLQKPKCFGECSNEEECSYHGNTLFSRSRWSGYSVFDNGNEASEVTERRLLSISVTEVSFSIWIINNQFLPSKPLRLHNIIKAWNLLGLIKLCIELRHNSNRELYTESVLSSAIEYVITRANTSSMFIQGFWDRWWIVGTGCLHSQIFDIFSHCLLPLFSWK